MKKVTKLLCAVVCFALGMSVASACNGEVNAPEHVHTYAENWTITQTEHYKKATCEHAGERGEAGEHTYGTGDKANECTVCGYVNAPEHVHTFETEWTKTPTGHYKKATCEHTDEMGEAGTHTWGTGDKKDTCTVCGYVRTKTEEVEIWVSSVELALEAEFAVVGDTVSASSQVEVKHDSKNPDYEISSDWYEVTYESSDTTVATVSANGEIHALKVGRAKITAKSKKAPEIGEVKWLNVVKSNVIEAENDDIRLVGYGDGAIVKKDGLGYIKAAAPERVQTNKYNAKYNNSQIIFGIMAEENCSIPEIILTYASPYTDEAVQPSAAKLNELGNLFINGKQVELPATALKASVKGNDEVFTTISIKGEFSLVRGTNRIIWEAENKTDNAYTYLGGLDKIDVRTTCTLTTYKVMWWTDRNVYYDVAGGEPLNIFVEQHYAEAQPDHEIDLMGEYGINWAATDGYWGYMPKQGAARHLIKRSEYSTGEYVNILEYNAHSDGKGLWGDYDGELFYMTYYLRDAYEAVYDFCGVNIKKTSSPDMYGGYYVKTTKDVKLEAEAAETRLVGYETSDIAGGNLTTKAPFKVQADKYNAKYNNTQVIFGVIANEKLNGKLSINCEAGTVLQDAFNVYVNGTAIDLSVATLNVSLMKGTNRITVEPKIAGVKLDGITLTVDNDVTLEAYKVMWWTDRNVYYDLAGGEALNIFVDGNYAETKDDSYIGVNNGSHINWNASASNSYWGYRPNTGSLYYSYTQNSRGEIQQGAYDNILNYNPNTNGHYLWKDGYNGNEIILLYFLQDKYEYVYEFVKVTANETSDITQYGGYSNIKTLKFEAEAEETRLVGYEASDIAGGALTTKAPFKVQADKYNAKYNNTQIIFGFVANKAGRAEFNLGCTLPEGGNSANLIDVYVNGTKLNLADGKVYASFIYGTNRIAIEPKAAGIKLDNISLTVEKDVTLEAYKVMWWTDRNVYYDLAGGEELNIFIDGNYPGQEYDNGSYIGVYRGNGINWNSDEASIWGYRPYSGSLYWAYIQPSQNNLPTGAYENVLKYNPNSNGSYLWTDYDGDKICLVYFLKDDYSKVYEILTVTAAETSDVSQYGGKVA